jgi:hypothetical protein
MAALASPLGYRLSRAGDVFREFSKQSGSFSSLLDDLHRVSCMPPDVLGPLAAIAQQSNQPFDRITYQILNSLREVLLRTMDDPSTPAETIRVLLASLLPYIRNSALFPVFERIVLKLNPLPDDFLLELVSLSREAFSEMFHSESPALLPLFSQCRPLFQRVVLREIDLFCEDMGTLDAFLNAVLTTIEVRRQSQPGSDSQEFSFRTNAALLKDQTLSARHHDLCRRRAEQLLAFCCDNRVFFEELCCILRDLWERSRNPLLAALRLELGFASQTRSVQDPIRVFAVGAFEFCDTRMLTKIDCTAEHPDIVFASHDPMLRALLHCTLLANVLERVRMRKYCPYAERGGLGILLRLLVPGAGEEELEDLANNIEGMFIAVEVGKYIEEICEDLQRDAVRNEFARRIILLFGYHFVVTRSDTRLFGIARDTGVEPDIGLAVPMMRRLADVGLGVPNSDVILELLIAWAQEDRFVRIYLLAMFEKLSRVTREGPAVTEWMERVESECWVDATVTATENALLKAIKR